MALHKKQLVKFLSQIEINCSKHSLNSGEILAAGLVLKNSDYRNSWWTPVFTSNGSEFFQTRSYRPAATCIGCYKLRKKSIFSTFFVNNQTCLFTGILWVTSVMTPLPTHWGSSFLFSPAKSPPTPLIMDLQYTAIILI